MWRFNAGTSANLLTTEGNNSPYLPTGEKNINGEEGGGNGMSTEKDVNGALPGSQGRNLVEVTKRGIDKGNVAASITKGDSVVDYIVPPVSNNFRGHDWRQNDPLVEPVCIKSLFSNICRRRHLEQLLILLVKLSPIIPSRRF